MKIVIFGLGSIGQRHAKVLIKHFKHELYAFRSKRNAKPNELEIKEIFSWKEVKNLKPDIAFITNPTSLHIKTALKCARFGMHLFMEKPIDRTTQGLDELMRLVRRKNLTTYIAYCMRFNPVIEEMRKIIRKKPYMHVNITLSSYLPDWRPEGDYRIIHSARKEMGGGVLLDLSHEIDYTGYLLEDIMSMQGVWGRMSNLEINCEDYTDIILRCKKGTANVYINFFSRKLERKVHIDFYNGGFIEGDLIAGELIINDKGKERKKRYKFVRDDLFLSQLKYFFKNFHNKHMMNNLFEASTLFRKIVRFKKETHFEKATSSRR